MCFHLPQYGLQERQNNYRLIPGFPHIFYHNLCKSGLNRFTLWCKFYTITFHHLFLNVTGNIDVIANISGVLAEAINFFPDMLMI